jgi:hypothetical protein
MINYIRVFVQRIETYTTSTGKGITKNHENIDIMFFVISFCDELSQYNQEPGNKICLSRFSINLYLSIEYFKNQYIFFFFFFFLDSTARKNIHNNLRFTSSLIVLFYLPCQKS